MPFELGEAVNGGAGRICSSPFLNKLVRNPVTTALIITALALIVVHAVYREELGGVGRKAVKAGFWILAAAGGLTFLHYYALRRDLEEAAEQRGARGVVDAVNFSVQAGGGYAVAPATLAEPRGPEVLDARRVRRSSTEEARSSFEPRATSREPAGAAYGGGAPAGAGGPLLYEMAFPAGEGA